MPTTIRQVLVTPNGGIKDHSRRSLVHSTCQQVSRLISVNDPATFLSTAAASVVNDSDKQTTHSASDQAGKRPGELGRWSDVIFVRGNSVWESEGTVSGSQRQRRKVSALPVCLLCIGEHAIY